jgi:succinyl-diaminopimelate desuccinylase
VVPAGAGWTVDPFKGDIVDGKIYGRGSSDMKGGIASVLTAVKALHDSDISLSLTPDEETGGALGAAYVVKNRLITTEMAVLPEPTGLKTMYNACKGALWVEVTVPGKAGHPSVKGYGDNAFDKMVKIGMKLLTVKDDVENRKSRLKAYPEGGEWATLNAGGRCSSGAAVNAVPGKAVFTIDRRIIPEEDAEQAKQEITACVDDACVTILLEAEPFYIEESAPVCQLMKQCVEPVIRDSVTFALCPGFLDARHFVHAGIPCVTWGPGIYTQAHAADEYIRICDVMTAAHVFYNLASIKGM